jgi:hypothetical protein
MGMGTDTYTLLAIPDTVDEASPVFFYGKRLGRASYNPILASDVVRFAPSEFFQNSHEICMSFH